MSPALIDSPTLPAPCCDALSVGNVCAICDAYDAYVPPKPAPAALPERRRGSRRPNRSTARRTPSLAQRRLQAGLPVVAPRGNRRLGYVALKRALDIVGALLLLAVLGPLMLAILAVLTVTTKGRPLYCQRRSGYLGRPFRMFKFRTMAADADRRKHEVANEQRGPIFKNRRDPRITRIGQLLRKTSLDETPQLISVLLGQMSLVGPRPLPVAETAQMQSWHRERLAVKPGLTCLWQVSGRSDVGFEDWMRLDVRYVRSQSLRTDMQLLVRTPLCVITGKGAY